MTARKLLLPVLVSALLIGCQSTKNAADQTDGMGGANTGYSNALPYPGAASALGQDPGQLQDRIFFALDSSELDGSARGVLENQARWLNELDNKGKSVIIEGHCDERGTREYNLALGERRANSVKEYLMSLGVESARIRTISYGKERPAIQGSNEEAWAQNRRAVTVEQ